MFLGRYADGTIRAIFKDAKGEKYRVQYRPDCYAMVRPKDIPALWKVKPFTPKVEPETADDVKF